MAELDWGRRYLMCPPEHFGVLYEINPWMNAEVSVDPDRAREQWEGLKAALEAAGAEVEVVRQTEAVPDAWELRTGWHSTTSRMNFSFGGTRPAPRCCG